MSELNPVLVTIFLVIIAGLDIVIKILTFAWVGIVVDMLKKMAGTPLRSVPVKDDESHRVHADFKGKLQEVPSPGMTTLYECAKKSFEQYAKQNCMGEREFKGWKSAKIREFGDVTWKTYEEIGTEAYKFGAALRGIGHMDPAPDTTTLDKCKTHSRFAIFENTCPNWMTACIGAFTQGITVTTVYATLGMDAVVEAVVDNSIPVMLCNKKDVPKVVEKIKKMPSLKVIVYTNDQVAKDDKTVLPHDRHVKIMSFQEFIDAGDTKAYPPTPPKPDSCAVVMYTSGSTGKPKGVLIKHSQVVAAMAGFCTAVEMYSEDVYLSYLPCAHIMELLAEFTLMSLGSTLCYADPKSLTTSGAYPIGALEQYKPTMMAAVPKVWDVIKKGIQAKIALSSPVLQMALEAAFRYRTFLQKNGYDVSGFIDKALFGKLKGATGGRLRIAMSGGGPLNEHVQNFSKAAFGIQLIQGYGLTETNACLTVQAEDDNRGQVCGVPVSPLEVKLVSTPDVVDKAGMPYMSTDRNDVYGNPVFGRGEVCCKGGCVASGYYMMPDKTKEVFEDNGWFHTGDIGQFMTDGSLRIVDRKKNLVKLKGGEYIALEKMEMTYGNSPFVDAATGGICCYGDGEMDRPVALLQANPNEVMKWAKKNGKGDVTFEKLIETDEVHDVVLKALQAEHKESGELSHLEKLVAVKLLNSPWTPENGCLTAANKLSRQGIFKSFEKEFEATIKKGIF